MPLKMYRYSDGNTYTDNLTLREAQRFVRLQNGGTVSEMEHPRVSHPDLAALLRSMASARDQLVKENVLTINVRNHRFDVAVNGEGFFCAELHDETIKSSTLEGLKDALNRALAAAAVKVSVPFILYAKQEYRGDEHKIRRGTITGKHAGNRNYLVKWDSGKTEQARPWELEGIVPLKLESKFLPVVEALRIAREAYDAFIKEHGIDLEKEVDEKVEKSA